MLSKVAPDQMDLSASQELSRDTGNLATRKIWLPKLAYDCLPYFYLTAGFVALFATLYISEWFWVLPHYLLFSAACIHFGILVHRKRRDVRRRESEQQNP